MKKVSAVSSNTHISLYIATACEVLARRIVHLMPQERLAAVMSTRYRFREADGDESAMSSALELAIDSGW